MKSIKIYNITKTLSVQCTAYIQQSRVVKHEIKVEREGFIYSSLLKLSLTAVHLIRVLGDRRDRLRGVGVRSADQFVIDPVGILAFFGAIADPLAP